MKEWASKVVGDVKFFLWRSKKVKYRRIVSVLVIVVVLVGLTFVSYRSRKAVAASSASWDTAANLISISGANADYLLINNGTADGTCLWPLNKWSADNFSYAGKANYRGKACTTTPQNLALSVTDYATIRIVGDVTIQSLSANAGIVTTARSDIRGKAATYVSRSDYFTAKFSGFIKLNAGVKYDFIITDHDDAAYFEIGRGDKPSIDDAGVFDQQIYTYNYTGEVGCSLDGSFLPNGVCGKGTLLKSVNTVTSITPGSTVYLPYKFSAEENAGGVAVMVQYRMNNGSWANLPVDATNGLLYAPIETGADVGKVDTTARGKARFEFGSAPLGIGGVAVDRDMSNVDANLDQQAADWHTSGYGFFSRVDITKDGDFRNYGKGASTQYGQNLGFTFDVPTNSTAGNLISNASRKDGYGYIWGMENNISSRNASTLTLLQNYNLIYHIPANNVSPNTGIDAGLKLTVTGDVDISNRSYVTTNGFGLPGGRVSDDDGGAWGEMGRSGMGGNGRTGSPGWYMYEVDSLHGPFADPGSNWANGMGGGGGASGKYSTSWHFGVAGGGGGVIGAGSGGFSATSNNGKFVPVSYDQYSFHGHGGAGISGMGGGMGANNGTYVPTGSYNGLAGTSRLNMYNSFNVDDTSVVQGGGGGATGNQMVGNNYSKNIGGSGGGQIRLNISGNLTVDNSYIDSSGANANDDGDASGGGGGGGLVYIKVAESKVFALNNGGRIYANGGMPTFMKDGNNYYGVGGAGGGGLIKISAGSYETNDSAWPTEANLCVAAGATSSLGHLYVNSGDIQQNVTMVAENGLLDLRNANGTPFCGGTSTSMSGNIQITKRIEQMNQGATENVSDDSAWTNFVGTDGNWNNIVTVVPGGHIRTVITVTNPDSTTINNAKITDKLPFGDMTIDRDKIMIRRNGSVDNFSPKAITVTAGSFEFTYNLLGNSEYEFMYTSVTTSPFSN